MSVSFPDCHHNHVQHYTECCLECGYNIYTTNKEYLKSLCDRISRGQSQLGSRVDENDPVVKQIRAAERRLTENKKDDETYEWNWSSFTTGNVPTTWT